MNLSHVSDELLQRHFDGDLAPEEEVEARKHLADCSACTARLQSLGRLQGLIRMATQDAAAGVDFHGLLARVEQATAGADPSQSGAAASRARARWFRPATVSTLGALAVAAAVLLMIFRDDGDHAHPSFAGNSEASPQAALHPSGSEIVAVDFGDNAGTVFEIAMADGSSTPVVWINDEE